MTTKKIAQEIADRVSYLEKKEKELNVREMSHKKRERLRDSYLEEITALKGALRMLKKYLE